MGHTERQMRTQRQMETSRQTLEGHTDRQMGIQNQDVGDTQRGTLGQRGDTDRWGLNR